MSRLRHNNLSRKGENAIFVCAEIKNPARHKGERGSQKEYLPRRADRFNNTQSGAGNISGKATMTINSPNITVSHQVA